MYGPSQIMAWLEEKVQGVRRSRLKTLAAIVGGAMVMQGVGVLALGRSMAGPAKAKHRIKRVDRFLGNRKVELHAIGSALFHALRPRSGPVVVLADWTDRHGFVQLALALPFQGRALPFYSVVVEKGDGSGAHEGLMIEAEAQALEALSAMCGDAITPVIIADRGFGNRRWLEDIQNRGWHFVQRLARNHSVDVEDYLGVLSELGIRRGYRPKDWGWGVMGEKPGGKMRLVTVYDRDAKEPWHLATNLPKACAGEVVNLYKKRMWIEAAFRDLKNRNWGMGMDAVKLSDEGRIEPHFIVLVLAYLFLTAYGAVAEADGAARHMKANTVENRVLNLARIGQYFLAILSVPITYAINRMLDFPELIKTGDY